MREDFSSSFCEKEGVKFPKPNTQKSRMLEYFWKNTGKLITKEEVQKYFADKFNNHSDIQSVRHLGKQDGFAVLQYGNGWNGRSLKKGEYVFEGFSKVNHFYSKSRRVESSLDFESKKKELKKTPSTNGRTRRLCWKKVTWIHQKRWLMTTSFHNVIGVTKLLKIIGSLIDSASQSTWPPTDFYLTMINNWENFITF